MKNIFANFKSFFAMELEILWCRRTHRVRFCSTFMPKYVYVST